MIVLSPAEELDIGQGRFLEADARNPRRASMASPDWKGWATKYLTIFCQSFAHTKAGNSVGGIQLAYGIYGEWHQWGLHQYEADFSAAMMDHFQGWLQQKYRDDKGLQGAWGQPKLSIDQVMVPTTARRTSTAHGIFRDPVENRDVIDYYDCQHELIADLIIHFSEIVDQQWPRRIIKGVFYGYFFSMFNRQAAAGHLALQKVLAAPTIDYLSGPQVYYPDAGFKPGEPYRSRSLIHTIGLHGKLWLDEYDQQPRRTWPYLSIQDNRGRYNDYLQENTALLKRSFLFPVLQGHGLWFYDFGPAGMHLHPRNQFNSQSGTSGYWDHPIYMDTIARLKAFADEWLHESYESNAEILAVYDTESIYYMPSTKERPCPITEHLINESTLALYYTGKLFDQIHLKDLNRVNLDQYRVVLFMNTFVLNEEQRTFIRDSVGANNRHLIWTYAPGISNDHQWDLNLAASLTGINLKASPMVGNPKLTFDNAFTDVTYLQMKDTLTPLIVVDDSQALAHGYFDNQEVGFARKDFPTYASWYSSLPITNDTIFRAIFAEAGCLSSIENNAIVYGSSDWRVIHKNDGGAEEVTTQLMKMQSGDFVPVSLPTPSLSPVSHQSLMQMPNNIELLVAIIALVSGVVSAVVTYFLQVRLEKRKTDLANREAQKKAFKLEISNCVQLIMVLVQNVSWISWSAQKNRFADKTKYLSDYDDLVQRRLAELAQKLAWLAATDLEVYQRLQAIARIAYQIDADLANALVAFENKDIDPNTFKDINRRANQMENELPIQFADIIKSVDQKG